MKPTTFSTAWNGMATEHHDEAHPDDVGHDAVAEEGAGHPRMP